MARFASYAVARGVTGVGGDFMQGATARSRRARLFGLSVSVFVAVGTAAAAQTAQTPLAPNDPSQLVKPPSPAAAKPLTLPPTPPAPGRNDSAERFVLRGAAFDGATIVSQKRLQRAWAGYLGRSVSLADLRAIGRRAEGVYARAGYPFVAVRLKVQQVEDGVVHYNVVEGRISELTVLGSNAIARRQATRTLAPLVDRTPLSLAEVNGAYALVRQIPGLSTSGTLRQGSEPGGMDLVVATKREDFRTYANVNNLYADSVGPWGVLLGADLYGDSDYGDVASGEVYTSLPFGRQILLRGSYSRGLDVSGDRLIVSGLWGQADPAGSATWSRPGWSWRIPSSSRPITTWSATSPSTPAIRRPGSSPPRPSATTSCARSASTSRARTRPPLAGWQARWSCGRG
jgi:hemolysin activation/secretion protein